MAIVLHAQASLAQCQFYWSTVGGGMDGPVLAMVVWDDDGPGPHSERLYAAGAFTAAGGVAANRIVAWDGQEWQPLGSGTNNAIHALAVHDDGSGESLFAAGAFTIAGDAEALRIARWDGRQWNAVGSGLSNVANVLAVFDDGLGGGPAMYAGGSFTVAGEATVNHVARWNGSLWSALQSGLDIDGGCAGSVEVRALATFDDGSGPALYVGGRFNRADKVAVASFAKWSGFGWEPVGSGVWLGQLQFSGSPPVVVEPCDLGTVHALHVIGESDGDSLYIGGNFNSLGGLIPFVLQPYVTKWSGGILRTMPGLNGPVLALCPFGMPGAQAPSAVSAGQFACGASGVASGMIQCDQLTGMVASNSGASPWIMPWAPAGPQFGSYVSSVCAFNDGTGLALYAGGLDLGTLPTGGPTVSGLRKLARQIPVIPADQNCDGHVNGNDLATLLGAWGTCPPFTMCPADQNHDGEITGVDLAMLLGSWTG